MDPLDLSSSNAFAKGIPHHYFQWLRENCPVHWNSAANSEPFWSVSRYDDIKLVSRSREFSALSGPFSVGLAPEAIAGSKSLISLDPPDHTLLKRCLGRLVDTKFLAPVVSEAVRETYDSLSRDVEFVEAVASVIPRRVIGTVLGIEDPGSAIERLIRDVVDCTHDGTRLRRAMLELGLLWKRLENAEPQGPLAEAMSRAYEGSVPAHVGASNLFLILLAGYETTKNALADAVVLLNNHPQAADLSVTPDGRQQLAKEIIRYSTPVRHMCRRAAVDVSMHGVKISAGQLVTLWYCSGNFDERVFTSPRHFDPWCRRAPNLSFGTGTHACLGASLAVAELVEFLKVFGAEIPRWRLRGRAYEPTNFVCPMSRLSVCR